MGFRKKWLPLCVFILACSSLKSRAPWALAACKVARPLDWLLVKVAWIAPPETSRAQLPCRGSCPCRQLSSSRNRCQLLCNCCCQALSGKCQAIVRGNSRDIPPDVCCHVHSRSPHVVGKCVLWRLVGEFVACRLGGLELALDLQCL